MADWVTISALASAGGTLVLAGVTVASVRSANRAARVAEQSLLAGQRPLLIPSRAEDPAVKVGFQDDVWFSVPGGQGIASATADAAYFVISVRNVGTGIAVLTAGNCCRDSCSSGGRSSSRRRSRTAPRSPATSTWLRGTAASGKAPSVTRAATPTAPPVERSRRPNASVSTSSTATSRAASA